MSSRQPLLAASLGSTLGNRYPSPEIHAKLWPGTRRGEVVEAERPAQTDSSSTSFWRSVDVARRCTWLTRDSVTPSTWPISASVRPSK